MHRRASPESASDQSGPDSDEEDTRPKKSRRSKRRRQARKSQTKSNHISNQDEGGSETTSPSHFDRNETSWLTALMNNCKKREDTRFQAQQAQMKQNSVD